MPTIQNFFVPSGDDFVVNVFADEVIPAGAEVFWSVYPQKHGVVEPGAAAILQKTLEHGIVVQSGDKIFSIELLGTDTASLLGSYFHEAHIVHSDGKILTPVQGLMTVTLTEKVT